MRATTAFDTLDNGELDALAVEHDRKKLFILYRDLKTTSSKKWLVHNLLGYGEASAVYGKPGDGKSVAVEDLALHVSGGLAWHGREVKQGAVVYIALERRKLVERRAIAFRIKHSIDDLPFAIVGGVHDFRDKRVVDHLVAVVRQVEAVTGFPVVLIVVDTLSRALCGGDENSPKDMGAIVNATGVLQLGCPGAHVLMVHHMPTDGGERMRGHGALLGAMDTTLHVVKGGDGVRTATVVKANDSEEGEQISFTLESVNIGADGDDTTAPVVVPADERPASHEREPRLTKNQQTMFSLLYDAGSAGLLLEDWNERARAADIGTKRKADLYDLRASLKAKNLVQQSGERWSVRTAS